MDYFVGMARDDKDLPKRVAFKAVLVGVLGTAFGASVAELFLRSPALATFVARLLSFLPH